MGKLIRTTPDPFVARRVFVCLANTESSEHTETRGRRPGKAKLTASNFTFGAKRTDFPDIADLHLAQDGDDIQHDHPEDSNGVAEDP